MTGKLLWQKSFLKEKKDKKKRQKKIVGYKINCFDKKKCWQENNVITKNCDIKKYSQNNCDKMIFFWKNVWKNPAYGRHRISWPMRIEAPILKEFFLGACMDGLTEVQTYRAEGGGHMSCYSAKTFHEALEVQKHQRKKSWQDYGDFIALEIQKF